MKDKVHRALGELVQRPKAGKRLVYLRGGRKCWWLHREFSSGTGRDEWVGQEGPAGA